MWSLHLLRFDFTLHHKPGCGMGKPNALLCRADHSSGQGDNDNLMLLSPTLLHIHVLQVHSLKVTSAIFSRRSDKVYDMIQKRNQ
jgi:hypothetical protein